MRILQVLTYTSADGAYGGPVAVARAQCAELARRGHEVSLVTGWDGIERTEVEGVRVLPRPVRRVPGMGFAGLAAPHAWMDVRRLARTADVVHLHYARDLVQLPAAALVPRGTPLVLQAHGMVRPDERLAAKALDGLFVRRTYRQAAAHLCLTHAEEIDVPRVGSTNGTIERIRNGVPLPPDRAAWAATPRVLFLARLQERKRPVAFVEMAARLLSAGVRAEFVLHGPDEGELPAVNAAIERHGIAEHVRYGGALAPHDVPRVLADAQAYVLPSVREVFPMALIEAMAAGLPSLLTTDNGVATELAERGTALVTPEDPASMAAALAPVLEDRDAWGRLASSAREDVRRHFSPEAVADRLEDVYAQARTRRSAR